MTRPAAAGPTIRAPLNAAELSATALTTSSRPTVSVTNEFFATLKSVLARPAHRARMPTCQYATTPVASSVARVRAVHACAAWVTMSRRRLATPAVALEVERPVGPLAPGVVAQLVGDPRTRGDGTLIVRIEVVDLHADELALDAPAHGTDRAVVALPADPDQAVAELDRGMEEHAVGAHEPRRRDLAKPERALQERERRVDVLIRNLGNDRRPAPGRDLLPDCRHEHCLSPVERRRLECGLAPQLPRQVHRLHRDFTLSFPSGSISSRRR